MRRRCSLADCRTATGGASIRPVREDLRLYMVVEPEYLPGRPVPGRPPTQNATVERSSGDLVAKL